ncbi:hypothetical protein H6F93_17495 [Leptolyngbya sp. FACHB-671]|uniref:hypothetical protein n=1 Tax=Leptolyngbya sp. FACHB-671 TaxID=2692812 RepID=UPI001686611B|nr:hypothetical protein [Leptolyngbya sp. FACHB-671]MBD2069290.1 hypothetical protein [Leptolyngbya sp. FACHB-671]
MGRTQTYKDVSLERSLKPSKAFQKAHFSNALERSKFSILGSFEDYKDSAAKPVKALKHSLSFWTGAIAATFVLCHGTAEAIATELSQPNLVTTESGNPNSAPLQITLENYPSFNSQRLDQQLRLYADHLNTFGVPDILIVGSSRALQGVDPVALQQALTAQGYPEPNVFNFSINGATAQVISVLLRQILTPDQLPQLIVWADGSRAFNSGRADITHSGILTSEGYRVLETGVRPIRSPQPQSSLTAECLSTPLTNYASCDRPSTSVNLLDLPPIYPILPEVVSDRPTSDLDSTGFQPVADRFNPTTYYREFPRVAGQYDSNYIPFELGGEQQEATIAIANFAQAQQIPLIFVNLPLTRDYLDPARQTYEDQFRQHMQQLAARAGFIFHDLSQQQELMQNEYFADPSHLNRYGASAVADQLAADPTIPWAFLLSVGVGTADADGTEAIYE